MRLNGEITTTSSHPSHSPPLCHATKLSGMGFHRTGVFIMGERNAGNTEASYANDLSLGVRVTNLEDEKKREGVFPIGVELGTAFTRDCFAYLNHDGGWVHAEGGTQRALENVRTLGGTVISGKTVKGLVRENGETGRTTGVRCADDSVYSAKLVVLATGSWTPSAFPESIPQSQCLATGCARVSAVYIYDSQLTRLHRHCVVTIRLTPEEANLYREVPVVYNQTTGFYIFPVKDVRSLLVLKVLTVVTSLAQCREYRKDGDPRWWSYPGHPDQSTRHNLDPSYYIDSWGDRRLSYTHRSR